MFLAPNVSYGVRGFLLTKSKKKGKIMKNLDLVSDKKKINYFTWGFSEPQKGEKI